MGVVIPNGYAQIIQPLRHAAASKTWSVTYGIEFQGTVNAQDTIDRADEDFRGVWRVLTDTQISFQPAVMYLRGSDGNLALWTSSIVAAPGLANRNSPPPQVAVAMRRRTRFVGKKFRGRLYFPGLLDETNVDENGVINGTGMTALTNAGANWLNTMIADDATGPMVLLHSDPTLEPTEVISLLPSPIVRTQRRRLPRT